MIGAIIYFFDTICDIPSKLSTAFAPTFVAVILLGE